MNLGAFPTNPAMQLADLQRRLAALERLAPMGSGVSTMFGRPAVRIMQPGFPAELTSAWDATNGYSWGRLSLYGVELNPNDAPLAGEFAVAVDGDETLEVGTRGWLEPDVDAGGWIFVAGTAGSSTASASAGSWLAGLESTDCLQLTVVSVSGKCSEIDPDQSIHLVWDAGDSRWEGTTDFVHDGGSGPVYFTDAAPALTIDGNSGRYLGADSEGLLFAFGKSPLCTEGTPATCNNSFVVRVKCGTCTELPGWDGPGWYCVKSPGDTGLGYRVELLEGDQYTDEIEIVSGPYATEALALEGCPSGGGTPDPVPTGCCTPPVARALTATVTTVGGAGCACLVGAWPLVWDGTSRWAGEIGAGCAAGWRFKIYCDGATWKRDDSPVATGSVGADSQSCSPLTITWTNLAFGGGGGEPCGGNVQVVVTEA